MSTHVKSSIFICIFQDQCIAKLESLGFRVGQSLVERFAKFPFILTLPLNILTSFG